MLKRSMLVGAMLAVSSTIALAGPCNTANRDAGSGPVTTGKAAETTGAASSATKEHATKEHAPTSAMNKASENTATSSQDAQRQMQSKPTAAEQPKTAAGADGKDC